MMNPLKYRWEKIGQSIINNMNSWEHSGFNVYCGEPVKSWDGEGVERLAQYIIRAPLSQDRMVYISGKEAQDGTAKVIYQGKTSRVHETFTALDWLARLVTHIPNRGEQTVRYYGYYSNKSRGLRKKNEANITCNEANKAAVFPPAVTESDLKRKKFRKNWARLIRKVYFTDPLSCPACGGIMKIISYIEDDAAIKKILLHLDLWLTQNHDPPLAAACGVFPASQFNRSYEWWEVPNFNTGCDSSDNSYAQSSYEDEYSQAGSWEY